MADPFEALRAPVVPADPDPDFAARLRARIQEELELEAPPSAAPITGGLRPADIVYVSLWVPDVERAAAFFASVLGWRYAPGADLQGRQVEGAVPNHGLYGGQQRSTLFLCFAVDDVEAAVRRVREAGGRAEEPRQEPYGFVADCVDDQGLPFALVSAPGGTSGRERPADVAYITIGVPDAERAKAFYGSVVGWRFTPGRTPGGWNVEDVEPMTGMSGGQDPPTVVPMYRVPDVAAAVERVRRAGGTATDPERQPYGVTAVCADDQGTRFYLGQL